MRPSLVGWERNWGLPGRAPRVLIAGAPRPGPRAHPKPAASGFGSRASPARTRVTFCSAKK